MGTNRGALRTTRPTMPICSIAQLLRCSKDNAPYHGDESLRNGRAACPQAAAWGRIAARWGQRALPYPSAQSLKCSTFRCSTYIFPATRHFRAQNLSPSENFSSGKGFGTFHLVFWRISPSGLGRFTWWFGANHLVKGGRPEGRSQRRVEDNAPYHPVARPTMLNRSNAQMLKRSSVQMRRCHLILGRGYGRI